MLYHLFFNPDYFNEMYNCSFYNVSDIPVENRQHVFHGSILLGCGIVFEILYIPCLYAMFQPQNLKHTCYKFMAYLAVVDSLTTLVAGIISGYFALNGIVYCSWPYTPIIHVFGTVGLGFWYATSSTSVILAFNRCMVMMNRDLASRLFDGNMAYVWLAFPTCYIFVAILFGKPAVFTSIHVGWYANPHIGYFDELSPKYYNFNHMVHNVIVLIILTAIYVVFFSNLCKRFGQMGEQRQFKQELSSFIQIMFLAVFNFLLCFTYVYMNFFPSELMTYLSSYSFLLDQGGPTVIYLTLNKTIRTELLKKLGMLNRGKVQDSSKQKDGNSAKKVPAVTMTTTDCVH
ncbi:SRT-29 protein [Aphelenchoides avenae]|nr:SRT-29 protein [Aphelenchus avenae]